MLRKKVIVLDPHNSVRQYTLPLTYTLKSQGVNVALINSIYPIKNSKRYQFEKNFFGGHYKNILISFKIISFPVKFIFYIRGWIKLYLFFFKFRPNILHVQSSQLPIIDYIFINIIKNSFPNIRLVFTVHNSNHIHGEANFLQSIFIKKYISIFSKFIFHSNYTKLYIDNLVNYKKYYYLISKLPIYNINDLYFEKNSKVLNKKLQVKNKKENFKLLFFGLIRHYKGVDILLEAIKKLKNKENLEVIIAGRPDKTIKKLLAKSKELNIDNCIEWDLNWLEPNKVNYYFEISHAIVLPYREIDGSGVVSTSLFYGKPIIASNIVGFREVVKDGIDGFLFENENSEHLANIIEKFMNDRKLLEKLSKGAKLRTKKWPTWQKFTKKHIEFYNSIIQ